MKHLVFGFLLIGQAAFGQIATFGNISAGSARTGWQVVTGGVVYAVYEAVEGRPSLKEVRASALPVSDAELAPESYIRQAQRMGMDASVQEATMLRAIHDAGLHVYDYAMVNTYLQWQAQGTLIQGLSAQWVWKPMRNADFKTLKGDSSTPTTDEVDTKTVEMRTPVIGSQQYSHAVPAEIMARAQTLLDCSPDAILLVSDFQARKPDPFLAVTNKKLLKAGKVWIVAQWNEPGFHESDIDYQATPVKKQPNTRPFAWLGLMLFSLIPYAWI